MATVTAHITTVEKPIPAGAGFHHYQYLLRRSSDSNIMQQGVTTDVNFTFINVDDNRYFVHVFAIDSLGQNMDGGIRSADFVVPQPTANVYQSPDVVTVTVT